MPYEIVAAAERMAAGAPELREALASVPLPSDLNSIHAQLFARSKLDSKNTEKLAKALVATHDWSEKLDEFVGAWASIASADLRSRAAMDLVREPTSGAADVLGALLKADPTIVPRIEQFLENVDGQIRVTGAKALGRYHALSARPDDDLFRDLLSTRSTESYAVRQEFEFALAYRFAARTPIPRDQVDKLRARVDHMRDRDSNPLHRVMAGEIRIKALYMQFDDLFR